MKRVFGVFVLTTNEQRLVIFVILVLVVGAWLKYRHENSLFETKSNLSGATALASPTPNDRK